MSPLLFAQHRLKLGKERPYVLKPLYNIRVNILYKTHTHTHAYKTNHSENITINNSNMDKFQCLSSFEKV